MLPDNLDLAIVVHLVAALAAGGVIGLERTYHGRAAGFRTHTLVCLASSLLMLLTAYQSAWLPADTLEAEAFRTDPTRMAQGIMTGIGFLGAGVIFKEGFTVRGLTTAASIWTTAAIGVLIGVGFYVPAVLATLFTLGTLSVFRWIEIRLPANVYVHHVLRFDRHDVMPEPEMRELMARHGFSVSGLSYRVTDDGLSFEYRMIIGTTDPGSTARLAESLRALPRVRAFRIAPQGD